MAHKKTSPAHTNGQIPSSSRCDHCGSRIVKTGIIRAFLQSGCCLANDVGGHTDLPPGAYRVRIVKLWDDDETGTRCIGKLLDPADIEKARTAGTTGFNPEDYRKYGEERYQQTLRDSLNFDPSRVFFNMSAFIPDAHE
jgi:hypothetical protein